MKPTELYGGAMSSAIPDNFIDVSDFRQVPDHQEVFASSRNDDSIIFEVMQQVDGSDEEAVTEHLKEISTLNQSEFRLIKTEKLVAPKLLRVPTFICTGVLTSHKWGRSDTIAPASGSGSGSATEEAIPVQVFMMVAIVRLASYTTDFLITYNAPLTTEDELEQAKRYIQGDSTLDRFNEVHSHMTNALNELVLHDGGLFG